ncbi:STAS domain-containing protein [Actinoplanes sp. NPDC048791]|uniref:STAS domain-containing protein n=1 Tax=Actinoplanes sp. NPDC048791 TaxID=3154623 RepID=UPI003404091D
MPASIAMTLVEPHIDAPGHSSTCDVFVSARDGQASTIAVRGDLDFAVQRAVQTALMGVIARDRPGHVVLDLSRLDFCDCAGARMLAEVRQRIIAWGGTCVAADPQRHVAWLMHWLQDHAS